MPGASEKVSRRTRAIRMAGTLAGRVLGKYRLIEKIGSGAMADVYRAIQIGLDRDVAVKVLAPALAHDRVMIGRFRHASQSTARLSHPNVITIFDSGETDGLAYYAMEYLRSRTLEDRIADEPALPMSRAIKIAGDVLKALAYAHERGVVHGGLTTASVKFDSRDNAVVTGWARAGAELDMSADIRAAGAVLYALITGLELAPGAKPLLAHLADATQEDLIGLVENALTAPALFTSAREMLLKLKNIELGLRARAISRAIDRVPVALVASDPSGPCLRESDDSWDVLSSLSAIITHEEERRAVARAFSWAAPLFLFGLVGVGWLVRTFYR